MIKLGQASLDIARQELITILHRKARFIRYGEKKLSACHYAGVPR